MLRQRRAFLKVQFIQIDHYGRQSILVAPLVLGNTWNACRPKFAPKALLFGGSAGLFDSGFVSDSECVDPSRCRDQRRNRQRKGRNHHWDHRWLRQLRSRTRKLDCLTHSGVLRLELRAPLSLASNLYAFLSIAKTTKKELFKV